MRFVWGILALSLLVTESTQADDKCRVIRDTMVSCLEAKTDDLPKVVYPKVEWLTLSKSTVPKISKMILNKFPKITDLHAENVGIETVDADAFKEARNLNWVDLSSNKIREIHPDLFSNSKIVDHFNISHNVDLAIPVKKPFLNAPTLKWLDLQSCAIREIYSETFSKITSLRDLSLANNFLKTLPDDVFANNRGLLSLDLTNNKIKTLSDQIFLNMRTMVVRFEDNPWNCDCQLTPLLLWSKRNVVKGEVKCEKPPNKKWKEIVTPQRCN